MTDSEKIEMIEAAFELKKIEVLRCPIQNSNVFIAVCPMCSARADSSCPIINKAYGNLLKTIEEICYSENLVDKEKNNDILF